MEAQHLLGHSYLQTAVLAVTAQNIPEVTFTAATVEEAVAEAAVEAVLLEVTIHQSPGLAARVQVVLEETAEREVLAESIKMEKMENPVLLDNQLQELETALAVKAVKEAGVVLLVLPEVAEVAEEAVAATVALVTTVVTEVDKVAVAAEVEVVVADMEITDAAVMVATAVSTPAI